MREYYLYIMANKSGTLYTGVASNIYRRTREHKEGEVPGFTAKYRIKKLVYVEATNDVWAALNRE